MKEQILRIYTQVLTYRVTTINVSRIWIEWAEWAALCCTANSPFPGHVYCRHPVQAIFSISVARFGATAAAIIRKPNNVTVAVGHLAMTSELFRNFTLRFSQLL